MFRRISRRGKALQDFDKAWNEWSELLDDTFFAALLLIRLARARNQSKAAQKNTVVSIRQELVRLLEEMFVQIRDLSAYSHGAEGSLASDIRVRGRNKVFDFGEQISGHFHRCDIAKRAQSQADNVLVGMFKVTAGLG